jgi:signal transduction histidine kinase
MMWRLVEAVPEIPYEGVSAFVEDLAGAEIPLAGLDSCRGRSIAHQLGDTLVIASVCTVASAMALAQGSAEDAACLGTIVDRLLAVAGSQLARTEKELHDETQTLLSEQLDPEQLARRQVAAEAMSIEEATDYAFRSLAASPVLTE